DDAVGLHHAGMDDIHIDIVAIADGGESLGEIRKGRVHRPADQEVGSRRSCRRPDDVDDASVRRLEQRPEQPRQPHGREIFQSKSIGERIVRKFEKITTTRCTGIVDKDVAAFEFFVDCLEQLLAAGKRPQIPGNRHWGRPSGPMALAAAARLSALAAAKTTCAPSRAKALAIALPIPRLPPLTTTTFPSNSFGTGLSLDFVQALYAASGPSASALT